MTQHRVPLLALTLGTLGLSLFSFGGAAQAHPIVRAVVAAAYAPAPLATEIVEAPPVIVERVVPPRVVYHRPLIVRDARWVRLHRVYLAR